MALPNTFKARQGQSIYDLTIQFFGDLGQLSNLVAQFDFAVGDSFSYISTNPIALKFLSTGYVCASVELESPGFILLESGFRILTESGDGILKE